MSRLQAPADRFREVEAERDQLAAQYDESVAHREELAAELVGATAERDRLKDALQRTLWQIEHDPPLLPQAKEIAREALNGGED